MNSETSMMAVRFRLQEWAAWVKEYQSCPAGIVTESPCELPETR